jgi:hypothetical protein
VVGGLVLFEVEISQFYLPSPLFPAIGHQINLFVGPNLHNKMVEIGLSFPVRHFDATTLASCQSLMEP